MSLFEEGFVYINVVLSSEFGSLPVFQWVYDHFRTPLFSFHSHDPWRLPSLPFISHVEIWAFCMHLCVSCLWWSVAIDVGFLICCFVLILWTGLLIDYTIFHLNLVRMSVLDGSLFSSNMETWMLLRLDS